MSERRAGLLAAAALAAVVGTHLWLLFVQVRHPEPFLNDSVLHFGLIKALASAPSRGQSLLDPWVPTWTLGFPVFHYYQNLPHFLVLGLWKASFGALSLLQSFKIVEWLAVGTLPVPVYLSLRKLGTPRVAAVCAGTLALWIRTDYLHGLDFESYVWQGLGQFAQAVGGWFLPLALAWTYRALRDGEGRGLAALWLTLTFLAHLALGYMAFMAAGLLAVLTPREIPQRLGRLAVLVAVAVAASAYVVVPVLRDFAYYNVSTLVPSWKYNSFGHETILGWLVRGDLFDFGRWPVLTVLVGGGLVWTAWRARRREPERYLLVLFVWFLLLFFGRPTWGKLLHLLPLGSGFHYSRAIFLVHLLGTTMAGLALGALLARLWRVRRVGPLAAAAVAVLLAVPLARDRLSYLSHNADLVRESAAGYAAEREDLERALAVASEDRQARVYAGQGAAGGPGWGGQFMVGWVPVYAWFPVREIDAFGYLHHMWSFNADIFGGFRERDLDHHRVFNISRIIAPPEIPVPSAYTEIERAGRFRVWARDGEGFLDLVDTPYTVNVAKKDLSRVQRSWLRSPLPAAGVYPGVRLTEEGEPVAGGLDVTGYDVRFPPLTAAPAPRGEILSVERRGEAFQAEVRADRPCRLVLRMSYHPGWRARVDGRPVEIHHVLPSYAAVDLEPGARTVEWDFDPGPLKSLLLGFGLLPLVILLSTGFRRSR